MTPVNISQLFNFSDDVSQNQIQTQGVAGLWNILHEEKDSKPRNFAYLADEVGLGKTLQALAVIALHLKKNPKAIAVVVVPKSVQQGWAGEWNLLMSKIYQPDGTLIFEDHLNKKIRIVDALICDNLHDFVKGLYLGSSRLFILRYSSFSRPVHFGSDIPSNKKVVKELEKRLGFIGKNITLEEINSIIECENSNLAVSKANEIYVTTVSRLINDINQQSPIMACFDEAQWLRNIKNLQNTHIEKCFKQSNLKKLFLSATPWHTGVSNIFALSTYLEDYQKEMIPSSDLAVNISGKALSDAVREAVKPWLIRRSRILIARDDLSIGKAQYRQLEEKPVPLFDSPFYGLSMLLVQKNLVSLLNDSGQNRHGGIRSGELSCFESLKRSLGIKRTDATENSELDASSDDRVSINNGPADANFLDALQQSYQTKFLSDATNQKYLPHAKMDDVITQVSKLIWDTDVSEKVIIFVRRVDTVSEIATRLIKDEQQKAINLRFQDWVTFCANVTSSQSTTCFKVKKSLPSPVDFWQQNLSYNELDLKESDDVDDGEESSLTNDFLRATRKKSGQQSQHGFMSSFRSRLLRKTDLKSKNPLGDMFLEPNNVNWHEWIKVLKVKTAYPTEEQELIALMHLMFLRNSDFLLELYIMQEYLVPVDINQKVMPLEIMLINLFKMLERWPIDSMTHLKNHLLRTRKMLNKSVEQWQVLKEKCFGTDNNGNVCRKELMSLMQQLIPVARYSGSEKTANADVLFRLPFAPSILICTDKYKEGVNLHLNCDLMIHYGLPVSSGDLEQRIGRIDRFGSLYSRRLNRFSKSIDPTNKMPLMKIQFPFLEGTLDERQVKHRMHQTRLAMRFHEGDFDERTLDQIEKHPLSTTSLSVNSQSNGNLSPSFDSAKDEPELVVIHSTFNLNDHSDKLVFLLEKSKIWLCYERDSALKPTIIKQAMLWSNSRNEPDLLDTIRPINSVVKLPNGTASIICFKMVSAYTYRWQLSLKTPWSNRNESEYQLSRNQYVYLQKRGGMYYLMSPIALSYLISDKYNIKQWLMAVNDIQQSTGRKRIAIGYVENLNGFIWQTLALPDTCIAEETFFKLAFELANTSDLLQHAITREDNEDLAWETPGFLSNWK
jgi:hypothetical protein